MEAVTAIEGTIGQSTTPAEVNSSATSIFALPLLTLNTEAAAEGAKRAISIINAKGEPEVSAEIIDGGKPLVNGVPSSAL